MAAVVTLSKGYDLDYVWRQVTPSAESAGYYITPAERGGEPPGRWWGRGAQALGFAPGQRVERGPYDLLFGERRAPDGSRLGRPPSGGRTAAEVYAQLLAAEPHATAERRRELVAEAASRARQSPLYFDLTVSFSKSVSVFHASLGENARLARQAGDSAGEAYWAGLVAETEDIIWQAVHAGFEYFQREAGYTRTGSHASRIDGRETGQWREAGLVVAHWLQHTSRDGDMQLHVHSQIAHIARTQFDGKWRAPDSYGYAEQLGAVAAVVSVHLEEALTRRFGVAWAVREDGHGFEVAGIPGAVMRVFSSRRASISAWTRARARAFEQRTGRAPSQWELARLAQAANFATRARKPDAAPDSAALHAQWSARLQEVLGVSLAKLAPAAWHARRPDPAGLTGEELAQAGQKALALAQHEKSAWTRADLVKYLGRVLPRTGVGPDAAVRQLEDLADRALAGEFGPVACLEAPEPVPVPAALVRADGRSVYQRHGGVRYATRAQLAAEERLLAQARAEGAPVLARAHAARLAGADVAQLDSALTHGPRETPASDDRWGGLRADQAAAVYRALTDPRTVTVVNAPAGSGKTRVLAAAARAWQAAGAGPAIGITPSQAARNTLAAAVPRSWNTAAFLGHLPGHRSARGPVPVQPGTLVLIDEGSMISTADMAALVDHAAMAGAKVILAGDDSQLQPVEGGGAMSLLAGVLGHVRLADPVRFAEPWERAASLRLRAGDVTVLADYDQHGRIHGGPPEQVIEAAARAYVAHTLEGTDVLLMAADHARRRELCRRVRDDLIRLGLVAPGQAARIGDGQRASQGDLIVCTRNDHSVEAGEPGRPLANGDLLRVEAVTGRGLLVRRALDADPVTGQRRWTGRSFLYKNHASCELGYAVTCHAAQSRTVHTGLVLITGTEDRQHAYVALSRGTRANHAYVFTTSPVIADPKPGTRPAPELARHDRLATQHAGQADPVLQGAMDADAPQQALGVLAQVIRRDARKLSATQIRDRSLADADHLAVLHAMWQGEITTARHERYQHALNDALPAAYRGQPSHKARWLWRTLRRAELAGLDIDPLLSDAIAERSLAGSRDVAAVIDARIRARTAGVEPLPLTSWAAQAPVIGDPEQQAFAAALAAAMDERTRRIGAHAAEHSLPWAVSALGPVPVGAQQRDDWRRAAAAIGAWRELSGWDHPGDPIGPEPADGAPETRAAWRAALAALDPAGDPGVRGLADGMLWHLRDTYGADTAWAPPWAGDQLRRARLAAGNFRLAAIRADAEAKTAASHGRTAAAGRQEQLAASYRALEAACRQRQTILTGMMEDRAVWERVTRERRSLAIAADAELRRRHPGQHIEPLRSAEPEPLAMPELARGQAASTLAAGADGWVTGAAAGRRSFAMQLAASGTRRHDHAAADMPWPADALRSRQAAILQLPLPLIRPAAAVLRRAADRDTQMETQH